MKLASLNRLEWVRVSWDGLCCVGMGGSRLGEVLCVGGGWTGGGGQAGRITIDEFSSVLAWLEFP